VSRLWYDLPVPFIQQEVDSRFRFDSVTSRCTAACITTTAAAPGLALYGVSGYWWSTTGPSSAHVVLNVIDFSFRFVIDDVITIIHFLLQIASILDFDRVKV
jgi:hypothetical protein